VAVKHAPQLGRLLLRELAAQLGHGRRRPSLRSARVPATSHVCEDRFLPPPSIQTRSIAFNFNFYSIDGLFSIFSDLWI
jgi:hypothetical protein